MRELISTLKKKAQAGNELSNILPKILTHEEKANTIRRCTAFFFFFFLVYWDTLYTEMSPSLLAKLSETDKSNCTINEQHKKIKAFHKLERTSIKSLHVGVIG